MDEAVRFKPGTIVQCVSVQGRGPGCACGLQLLNCYVVRGLMQGQDKAGVVKLGLLLRGFTLGADQAFDAALFAPVGSFTWDHEDMAVIQAYRGGGVRP